MRWEQVLRNLIHLCTSLHKDPKLVKDDEVAAAEEEDEEVDDGEEEDDEVAEEEVMEDGRVHGDAKKGVHGAAHRRRPEEGGGVVEEEAAAAEEEEKQKGAKKAKRKEGSKATGNEGGGGDGGAGAGDEELQLVEPVRAVKWLFQRLSHIARRNNGQQRACVFQVAAMFSKVILFSAYTPWKFQKN